MSLELAYSAPAGIVAKTLGRIPEVGLTADLLLLAVPNRPGDDGYTRARIPFGDFAEILAYVLKNTNLEENDVREEFVEHQRRANVAVIESGARRIVNVSFGGEPDVLITRDGDLCLVVKNDTPPPPSIDVGVHAERGPVILCVPPVKGSDVALALDVKDFLGLADHVLRNSRFREDDPLFDLFQRLRGAHRVTGWGDEGFRLDIPSTAEEVSA